MSEALAIDVVRDPGTELGASLDRFAGRFVTRHGAFGHPFAPARGSLLNRLESRWSPGALTSGLIEVFDGADFGPVVRDWSLRAGYDDAEFNPAAPFVVPVDPAEPMADLGGMRAARRPDPRQALRPVAVRQAPALVARPREQWRPVAGQRTLSPYPPALGRAGAIEPQLLRFPDVRADITSGDRRALIEDSTGAGALPWAASAGLDGPRAAEAFEAHIAQRRQPTPSAPVAAWLVPAGSAPRFAEGLAEQGRAVPGRWWAADGGAAMALVVPLMAEPAETRATSMTPRATVAETPAPGRPGALAERLERLATEGATRPLSVGGAETPLVVGRRAEVEVQGARNPLISQVFSPVEVVPGRAAGASQAVTPARMLGRSTAEAEPSGLFAIPPSARPAAGRTLPWQQTPTEAAPFLPAALARLALALGEAVEQASQVQSGGWSALADGRTLVVPSAPAPTEAPRTRPSPIVSDRAQPAGRAAPRAELAPAPRATRDDRRSPAADQRPTAAAEVEAPGWLASARALAQAPSVAAGLTASTARRLNPTDAAAIPLVIQGLALLSPMLGDPRSGPLAADGPVFSRPFALAGALPEVDRASAPLSTLAAPTLGERIAAVAARAEVELGLTVASSPAGSLDAPWFAQDPGTLLVPLPAASSGATLRAAGAQPETTTPSGRAQVAERPPAASILALPPLAIAVEARARTPQGFAAPERTPAPEAHAGAAAAEVAGGAVLPLRAGPLDAAYVVPVGAPGVGRAGLPALAASGPDRNVQFAQRVAPTAPRAPDSQASDGRSGSRALATGAADAVGGRSAAGRPAAQRADGPLGIHPALTPFLSPMVGRVAAEPPQTLGERLAGVALAAFRVPTPATTTPGATRTLEPADAPRDLVVPLADAAPGTPAQRAARAQVEAVRTPADAPRMEQAPAASPGIASPVRPSPATPAPEMAVVSAGSADRGPASTAPATEGRADGLAPANRVVLLQHAGRTVDITAAIGRTEQLGRWLAGEGQLPLAALATRLEADGILAPGARIQGAWLGALTDLGALVNAPGGVQSPRVLDVAGITDGAPRTLVEPQVAVVSGSRERTSSALAAARGPSSAVSAATLSVGASAISGASRPSPLAWPLTLQRLMAIWQGTETTLTATARTRTAAGAAEERARVGGAAAEGSDWFGALDGVFIQPDSAAQAGASATSRGASADTPRAQVGLPGVTALAAAGFGTRLATRAFEELLGSAPVPRPMIGRPSPPLGRRSATRSGLPGPAGERADLLLSMGENPSDSGAFEGSLADAIAGNAVWPALVSPALGADAALGASEEWAGTVPPGGRLAGPANFERALLTWSAAAVRDAESRGVEQRSAAALGPLGQLVRQNAASMGSRSVEVPMRASTGSLFGDRGPAGLVAPDVHASRVLVDPGARAAEQALRSTPGERPARDSETSEEAKHRLSDQVGEELSPEETERLAREIIDRLKRELEFDAARMGDDAWD